MRRILNIFMAAVLSLSVLSGCQDNKMKVLIVTGQSAYHNWEESHQILQEILENSDMFSVETSISPAKGEDMSGFSPDFSSFDVVVLDYMGDEWPEKTKKNFVKYVKNGGGVVVYHYSVAAFPGWKEYRDMIGLGWTGKEETSGTYVYYNGNGELIRDNSKGKAGSHGPAHEFVVEVRDQEHPIVKGLPKRWLHPKDELYQQLRGPADNLTVLATAWANPKLKGTGRNEPMLMTVNYEKGRIFSTVLGHVGKEDMHVSTMDAGFILTLQRGAEWAATGNVTQKLPEDLPNIGSVFILPQYKFYSLDELFEGAKKFEFGKPQRYLYLISNRIRNAKGDKAKLAMYEDKIIEVLKADDATPECKNYLCREISWMGTEKSVPVLNELLKVEETREMAQYALTRMNYNF
jgi:type 1 glutamine amidotransferase